MKKCIGLFIVFILLFNSCKTTTSLPEESFLQLKEHIDSVNYVFVPNLAMPIGGPSINLASNYSLKITKDTIIADLPYFGRAYSAPLSSSDVGIKFVSTDFKYKYSFNESKKKWQIKIIANDGKGKIEFVLGVNSSANGTLSVYDPNRQVIVFMGQLTK